MTLQGIREELAAKGELRLKLKVAARSRRSEIAGFVTAVLLLSHFGALGKPSAGDDGR